MQGNLQTIKTDLESLGKWIDEKITAFGTAGDGAKTLAGNLTFSTYAQASNITEDYQRQQADPMYKFFAEQGVEGYEKIDEEKYNKAEAYKEIYEDEFGGVQNLAHYFIAKREEEKKFEMLNLIMIGLEDLENLPGGDWDITNLGGSGTDAIFLESMSEAQIIKLIKWLELEGIDEEYLEKIYNRTADGAIIYNAAMKKWFEHSTDMMMSGIDTSSKEFKDNIEIYKNILKEALDNTIFWGETDPIPLADVPEDVFWEKIYAYIRGKYPDLSVNDYCLLKYAGDLLGGKPPTYEDETWQKTLPNTGENENYTPWADLRNAGVAILHGIMDFVETNVDGMIMFTGLMISFAANSEKGLQTLAEVTSFDLSTHVAELMVSENSSEAFSIDGAVYNALKDTTSATLAYITSAVIPGGGAIYYTSYQITDSVISEWAKSIDMAQLSGERITYEDIIQAIEVGAAKGSVKGALKAGTYGLSVNEKSILYAAGEMAGSTLGIAIKVENGQTLDEALESYGGIEGIVRSAIIEGMARKISGQIVENIEIGKAEYEIGSETWKSNETLVAIYNQTIGEGKLIETSTRYTTKGGMKELVTFAGDE